MSIKEKAAQIGKKAKVAIERPLGIVVDVIILDYKSAYGRDYWLVKPVSGTGEAWVRNIKV